MVEPVRAIWVAAPWTTVKAPRVPVVTPAEVASIVTEPTRAPVIVLVATPLATVALPVPVTVPAPDCFANAITVVLSEVTVFPAASCSVAVKHPRRAGGQVGRKACQRDLCLRTVGDRDRGGCAEVDEGTARRRRPLLSLPCLRARRPRSGSAWAAAAFEP